MLAPLSEKDGDVFDLSFAFAPTYYSEPIIRSIKSHTCIRQDIDNVPGAFIIEHLMSDDECHRLCEISEKIGYTKTRGIGTSTTQPPDKFFYSISPQEAEILFARCEHLIPQETKAISINPWFRLYKYTANSSLNPHYDRGNYHGSTVDSDGELRYDYYKDGRISQMSCLIYLNDGVEGGDTIFYVNEKSIPVTPKKGNAVFFYHGNHKLSPLHEGSVVTLGTKYIIRTDLLCKSSGM